MGARGDGGRSRARRRGDAHLTGVSRHLPRSLRDADPTARLALRYYAPRRFARRVRATQSFTEGRLGPDPSLSSRRSRRSESGRRSRRAAPIVVRRTAVAAGVERADGCCGYAATAHLFERENPDSRPGDSLMSDRPDREFAEIREITWPCRVRSVSGAGERTHWRVRARGGEHGVAHLAGPAVAVARFDESLSHHRLAVLRCAPCALRRGRCAPSPSGR